MKSYMYKAMRICLEAGPSCIARSAAGKFMQIPYRVESISRFSYRFPTAPESSTDRLSHTSGFKSMPHWDVTSSPVEFKLRKCRRGPLAFLQ